VAEPRISEGAKDVGKTSFLDNDRKILFFYFDFLD
jgi:hypothetical protein